MEKFFTNIAFNGRIQASKICYYYKDTGLRVIKPLLYASYEELKDFCNLYKLPVLPVNEPYCFIQQ
jgi:tRNA(Ile)-lysidine synthase TilS/MesJ